MRRDFPGGSHGIGEPAEGALIHPSSCTDPGVRFAACDGSQQAPSDAGTLAIFVADARLPDTPIVFVNDAFTRATGLLREDVVGRSWKLLSIGPLGARATAGDWSHATIAVGLPDLGPDLGDDPRGAGTRFSVHLVRNRRDEVTARVGVSQLAAAFD